MTLEKLTRSDRRLIAICAVASIVSLFVGVKYYFLAFPEASIEFRVTRESSVPVAESFLTRLGLDASGYRHAAVFGFDDEAKTFLERELGVAETNRLLETKVRLWRWQHRWFRPLQKEEMSVDVTTKGEVVDFTHLLPEEAEGADLSVVEARKTAETFLVETMGRPLDDLSFVETSMQKRPHRTDHSFTWKVKEGEIQGADYRIEMGVAGSQVSGYREFLKVPDTWIRDYAKLRSKNEITGQIDSVLLLLTLVAMLVFLVLRLRRGDVRFRPASILGGLIFVLLTLSQLNSLPSDLHGYDTTTSFAGFLTTRVLFALLTGLVSGVAIFLFAAAAEPLYRERFPRMLSLASLVRLRALRSREFFLASLVGIALTFFFFAYENVFYLIANSFGAWAPRDVAYSDLLSTTFPWVYVLFFGFFPAISEEFISRMFSIPFLERMFRSTVAAVVVSAFVWGFGHAGYPNQPFWIRGLEVGLAGIVFGLVMLRFGIVAVVICHFSVDALYTAFILIRSPNLYYRISGTLAGGFFGLVFLLAAGAYLKKGGFLPAEVTNEAEGVAPPPEPRTAPAAAPVPPTAYRALSRRRIAWGVALAATLLAVSLVPVDHFGDWVAFHATRESARRASAGLLGESGFDVSSYRSALEVLDRTEPSAGAYLLEAGGLDVAKRFYRDLVPTPLWRVRYFVPGQKEEYWVSVDPRTGGTVGFSRTLLDDAPGASLPKEEALERARAFLKSHDVDPDLGVLKEQTEKDEKARRDHTLVWEFAAGAGEAKARHEVVVQGDAVGSWLRQVKIPEDWQRRRERQTAITVILQWLKLPFLVLLSALAVLLFLTKIRAGEIPWKLSLLGGAISAAVALLRTTLSLDAFWVRYDTSIPAGGFLIVILIGLFVRALFFFLAGTAVASLAGALFPDAVATLRCGPRDLLARDALVAGALSFGLVQGLPSLMRLVQALVPSGRLITGVASPPSVETTVPFLFVFSGSILSTIFLAGIGAIGAGVLSRYFRGVLGRLLLLGFFVLSFLPGTARTAPEYLVATLGLGLLAAGVVVLTRYFLRDNPFAWLFGAFFGFGAADAARLIAEPSPFYRWNGWLMLLAVAGPALWLLLCASRRRWEAS